MYLMDVSVFCDAPFEWAPGQPMWYTNQLFLKYHIGFDAYFGVENEVGRVERMKADFCKVCKRNQNGYVVMYTHPCRLLTTQFPDNFRAGKNPPRCRWEPAPLRPREEIDAQIRDINAFLEWVATQAGIEPSVYREVWDEYRPSGTAWLSKEDLEDLAVGVGDRPDWSETRVGPLSPAEQFSALAFALYGLHRSGELPKEIPIASPMGPGSSGATEEGRASGQDVIKAASQAYREIVEGRQIPERISLGVSWIGPSSLLQAMATCYRAIISERRTPEHVPLVAETLPVLADREDIAGYRFGDWSILPPGFQGDRVREMIRLQTWTAKPARRT
jgi:hypothetical protein